jgi:AcrR family transcriptional regulator
MTAMSTSYDSFGRTDQKSRTRAALVAAARELVARGSAPTVEHAAAAASVSRTTAYRYFPNQRALLAAAHPETAARSMLGEDPPDDPAERLDEVVRAFTAMLVDTEAQQRTMLRLSLQQEPGELPLRQGRAIGWVTEALDPLRDELPDDALHRLVLAIRSAIGIEALVWLTDVAGLSRPEAVDLMRWTAGALLHTALTTGPPPLSGARRSPG